MLGVLFLIIFCFFLNQVIFNNYQRKHPFFDKKMMNLLYIYHVFFYIVYYWYVQENASDSKAYYEVISTHTGSWFELFGTDTDFIHFLGYPFFKLGFTSYETLMFIFSWFGYIGFIYAYMFFRENITVKIKVLKSVDFLTLLLFLPNMHFWTVSLAKGAPIFLGIMMFTYAIAKPKNRLFLLVLSSIIIFHIRPHVFMFVAVGAVLGYMSGKEKIPIGRKIFIFVSLVSVLILAKDQILAVVNLQNSDNLVSDLEQFTEKRSGDLSEAGSGVDMSSYPLPLKLFTFWFRPLFFDAPSFFGIIISFENLLYLFLVLKIVKKDFIKFIRKSPSMVKMSFVIFLMASLAMTFVMSNLGIIMRQKQMVMYFLFFVIYYYLAQKKYKKIIRIRKLRKLKQQKQQQKLATA